VEYADSPGTTLVASTNQPYASNWFKALSAVVLPSDVSAAITSALAQGWHPMRPGSPFHLEQSDGFVGFRP
jgi:hypothetical protein